MTPFSPLEKAADSIFQGGESTFSARGGYDEGRARESRPFHLPVLRSRAPREKRDYGFLKGRLLRGLLLLQPDQRRRLGERPEAKLWRSSLMCVRPQAKCQLLLLLPLERKAQFPFTASRLGARTTTSPAQPKYLTRARVGEAPGLGTFFRSRGGARRNAP